MSQEITTVLRVISDTKDAEKGQENLAKNIDRTSGSIDHLIKRLEAERDRIGRSAHEYDIYRAKMAGATQEQLQHIAAIQKQITAEQAHTSSMKGVNQQFRFMRGGFGQVGHQIQDIAVQLQMGTNAMLVFGQQGSQIASLFGPGGAMLGALAAVGAAFFTYYQATKEAKKGTKELREEIEKYAETVYKLAEAESLELRINYVKEIDKKKDRIKELTESLAEQKAELESSFSTFSKWGKAAEAMGGGQTQENIDRFNKGVAKSSEKIAHEEAELTVLNRELERHQKILDSLAKGENPFYDVDKLKIDGNNRSPQRQSGEERERDKAAKAEIARQKRIATAQHNLELKNAMVKGPKRKDAFGEDFFNRVASQYANVEDEYKSQLELAENHYSEQLDLVQRYGSLIGKSEKETAEMITEIQRTASEARRAIMLSDASMVTGIMGQQVEQLAGFFDQTSAIGKAFFAVSQAIAAADAIIKGYQAGMAMKAAVAPMDPTGTIGATLYASSVAMGYATAGAIAGQTIASFEGGGITFDGIRAGGMDGKGGRMAVVHPNEKITDMTQDGSGGASGVNVNFSIVANDTRGFDELLFSRRGQIVKMINQAMNNRGQRGVV